MSKTNKIIKAVGVSTVIVLSNTTLVAAEDVTNSNNAHSSKESKELSNLKSWSSQVVLSASALPESIGVDSRNQRSSYFSNETFSKSIPIQVAQETDSESNIILPAQQPIPDAQELNPNANPLSFPTEADEVEAGAERPITLEQAIELALKNNKDVQVSRLNLQRADEALREARAALFPTLLLNGGLDYSNTAFSDSITEQQIDERVDEALADNPNLTEEQVRASVEDSFTSDTDPSSLNFTSDITLNYNIYTGGLRGAEIRRAEQQLRSSELELESVVEETRFQATSDYYALQNSDAQVEIEQAAVEDATQTLRDAQLLEQAGLGTRFDVLQAEVELAQAQQRLSTAQANQSIARRQLAETLSLAHTAQLTTADAIEEAGTWELSLEESIIQAFKNRAELEQFLVQREIEEQERQIALSAIRPQVGVSASYQLNDDFEDDFDLTDQYLVGINLRWTLFDGGAARAAARQNDTDREIAETQFSDQRNQVRFEVEQAFFLLEANQENISTATKAVELAEESLRLARLRFQAGVGTQTEVIDAQTALTAARGDLVAAIIDYNQSFAQLQRAVTNLPDNSLQDLP